jgi:O-antigen/teichoic acid export membrane protein
VQIASAGSFGRSVRTLATGTAAAQAISLLTAPVLSRLYAPADYGTFALYNSFLALGAAFATAKYENAIMLPATDEDGWSLVLLSGAISIGAGAIVVLIVGGYAAWAALSADFVTVPWWLWFLPLGVVAAAMGSVLSLWLTRRQAFTTVAKNRVVLVCVMSIVHIVLGMQGIGAAGLFIGYALGEALRIGLLIRATRATGGGHYALTAISGMSKVWKRYRSFAVLSLVADTLNTVTSQIPVLMIKHNFGIATLGQYSQSERMAGLPARVLGSAIADVFRQRASADFARDGNCRALWLSTLRLLVVVAIPPATALLIYGPSLFRLVLGVQWVTAGEYAQLLAILFFFRFLSGTLSQSIYIAERQRFDALWQVALAMAVFASFMLGIQTNSIYIALLGYTMAYSALYIIYLGYAYRCACGRPSK